MFDGVFRSKTRDDSRKENCDDAGLLAGVHCAWTDSHLAGLIKYLEPETTIITTIPYGHDIIHTFTNYNCAYKLQQCIVFESQY